jgi:hypothetical protein
MHVLEMVMTPSVRYHTAGIKQLLLPPEEMLPSI